MKAETSGRTSVSMSGSTSSKDSFFEQVSLDKKLGPLNQLVCSNWVADTERDPWSAGLFSVLTKCHWSGFVDFLMRADAVCYIHIKPSVCVMDVA